MSVSYPHSGIGEGKYSGWLVNLIVAAIFLFNLVTGIVWLVGRIFE